MKKKLEDKLKEFVEIRKFANGKQRKGLIDFEVISYLTRCCPELNKYTEAYRYYKSLY
jgi:predicted house-cleaning noncanonical NTP pyrophosphatase (MazG superfamily)